MLSRIRSRLTYANVVATLALFLALGGVAYAGATIGSDDVINESLKSVDVRNDDLSGGGLGASDLKASSVRSSEVANGTIQNADIAPAAQSVRAYGMVSADGDLTQSKNVVGVTEGDAQPEGVYCIELAGGIDPDTALLVVGPQDQDNATSAGGNDLSQVEWGTGGADGANCPVDTLAVYTYAYNGDSTDDDDGGGNTPGDDLAPDDESFVFLVP